MNEKIVNELRQRANTWKTTPSLPHPQQWRGGGAIGAF